MNCYKIYPNFLDFVLPDLTLREHSFSNRDFSTWAPEQNRVNKMRKGLNKNKEKQSCGVLTTWGKLIWYDFNSQQTNFKEKEILTNDPNL